MATENWILTPILGNSATVVLSGYSAPFGRPRQKPVVKEIIKSRVQTTNYPGRLLPTRHSFGVIYEPLELTGRWMTKMLPGQQTAAEVADSVRNFVREELPLNLSWGNVVSYVGYIEELELGRESPDEIAWRIKFLVDSRADDLTDNDKVRPISLPAALFEVDLNITQLKLKRPGDLLADIAGMAAEFQDGIDGLVRDLNAPSAAMNKLAGIISDTEKATFSTLQHLRSAIKGFEIAFGNIRDTVLMTPIDAAIIARTVKSDVDWVQYQMDLDVRGNDIMALLAAMDRRAQIQQRQEVTGVITAKGPDHERGESWESLSTRATGNPASAGRIRELNGGGGHAIPGEDYVF